MSGSFCPTKWTLLQSFHFRILFWAKVNLKTKTSVEGGSHTGRGMQYRVREAFWQEPTETDNGKAPEVLGFSLFEDRSDRSPQLDAPELVFGVDNTRSS